MLDDHLYVGFLAPLPAYCLEGSNEPDVIGGCLHQIFLRELRGGCEVNACGFSFMV